MRAREGRGGRRAAWTVYVLRCRDGSLYTGMTNDLARRLAAHRAGRGAAYTRSRLPVRLVYVEGRRSRGAALSREAQIKRLPRRAKLVLTGRGGGR
jgi:predicted GIY-YIG superfamily endonuclease